MTGPLPSRHQCAAELLDGTVSSSNEVRARLNEAKAQGGQDPIVAIIVHAVGPGQTPFDRRHNSSFPSLGRDLAESMSTSGGARSC
ncbi:hypothetical protein O9K51_04470 [Purpureocillium lavendulum]|uniref:Uncharacterized protein n=1 Tax=Purpureocillium lavendulum TaxID=1247861 RepID=A0AB34FY99_9HYPO|nr:hypothetical protein O9K51_04470 [Purpureocillium lavendulum]